MPERDDSPPTIFIVDDELTVRHALSLLFRSVGMPVETFDTAQAFLDRMRPNLRGCLVTDLRMPLMGGIDLIQTLRSDGHELPAVVISGHGDIRLAMRAIKAGAHDFVQKPFNDQDILDAVNDAFRAQRSRTRARVPDQMRIRLAALTPREDAVLRRVVRGEPNKQIARALALSSRTVEAHRARVMDKLGVTSVAELVALSVRAGLVDDFTPESPDDRGRST